MLRLPGEETEGTKLIAYRCLPVEKPARTLACVVKATTDEKLVRCYKVCCHHRTSLMRLLRVQIVTRDV